MPHQGVLEKLHNEEFCVTVRLSNGNTVRCPLEHVSKLDK
jgi:hypothetical protein